MKMRNTRLPPPPSNSTSTISMPSERAHTLGDRRHLLRRLRPSLSEDITPATNKKVGFRPLTMFDHLYYTRTARIRGRAAAGPGLGSAGGGNAAMGFPWVLVGSGGSFLGSSWVSFSRVLLGSFLGCRRRRLLGFAAEVRGPGCSAGGAWIKAPAHSGRPGRARRAAEPRRVSSRRINMFFSPGWRRAWKRARGSGFLSGMSQGVHLRFHCSGRKEGYCGNSWLRC